MPLDVVTYATVSNPDGKPSACVAYVNAVRDFHPLTPGAIRMTQAEYSAYQVIHQPEMDAWQASQDAAVALAKDTAEPLLSGQRDRLAQEIAEIDAYLSIADVATAAQVRAEVKANAQRMRAVLRSLARLAVKEINR